VKKVDNEWSVYRTRFLIKAKQLNGPMIFVDALGREHSGQKGDYLMESSAGIRRIAPKKFFEDAYVSMQADAAQRTSRDRNSDVSPELKRRPPSRVRTNSSQPQRRAETFQPSA
jgi:hypothetical protein